MIKRVYCIRRRADVSAERFHDYWLNSHGPKVRAAAAVLVLKRRILAAAPAPM